MPPDATATRKGTAMATRADTRSADFVPSTRRSFMTKIAPAVAALPATGAAVPLPALAAPAPPAGTDPHVAWWREAEAIRRQADQIKSEMDAIWRAAPPTGEGRPKDWPADIRARYDAYFDRSGFGELKERRFDLMGEVWDLERQIASTPVATLEGAAIVAAVLVQWQEEFGEDEVEDRAGLTLANFVQGLAGRAS
jgi:hypothetical protein